MSEVVYSVKTSISSLLAEDQVLDRHPLAGGAEEVLLAGGADEIGVGVPVADVLAAPVFPHISWYPGCTLISAYCSERFRVGVVVAAVDVDVDAADRVDGADEAEVVDVDDVVDRQAGQFLDHLKGELRARRRRKRR